MNPYGPPPMGYPSPQGYPPAGYPPGAYPPAGYPGAYAAPNPLASKADPAGHKPGLRLWFLVCALAPGVCFTLALLLVFVGAVAGDPDVLAVCAICAYLLELLALPFLIGKLVIGMVWLHGAWTWLPPDQRYDNAGKPLGPDKVYYLLIPYFHFYWMFPINLQLCHAMDRLRAQRFPHAMTASKPDTALWAAICELIPFANFLVAPFLWASYMKRIDTMHEELQSLGA